MMGCLLRDCGASRETARTQDPCALAQVCTALNRPRPAPTVERVHERRRGELSYSCAACCCPPRLRLRRANGKPSELASRTARAAPRPFRNRLTGCRPVLSRCADETGVFREGWYSASTSPRFRRSEGYFSMSPRYRGSEQAHGASRRYGVGARLHGELDENAFDVGLHGLGGNLQFLSNAFVGKSIAHRAQDAVFVRTQR